MSNARTIIEWLRNSLIGFLLFLVAGFLSGVAQDLVPFDYPDLYLLWFSIALIPFFIFARSRGIGKEVRPGDAIIFVPMLLVSAFWPQSAVPEPELLFALAMLASFYVGHWLRTAITNPTKTQNSVASGNTQPPV